MSQQHSGIGSLHYICQLSTCRSTFDHVIAREAANQPQPPPTTMASPPSYHATSPPAPSSLALPRQRPGLIPPNSAASSRKPSTASATSSAHPLRQTSFPPPESLEAQHAEAVAYSPEGSASIDVSDSEINSAISGPGKRKRGESGKKARGRPPKTARTGSPSLANGDDGRSTVRIGRGATAGAASINDADGEAENDDDDEDPEAIAGDASMTMADYNAAKEKERTWELGVPGWQVTRFDSWKRSKLRTADVRRLVNQTLSQSVPANVVTVVQSYAKMFAGLLIEEAREVQAEWMAANGIRADGEANPAFKRLKKMEPEGDEEDEVEEAPQNARYRQSSSRSQKEVDGHPASDDTQPDSQAQAQRPPQTNGQRSHPDSRPPSAHSTQPNGVAGSRPSSSKEKPKADSEPELVAPGGAGNLSTYIEECDRGPLLPDHLREALKRYKKSRYAGTVGFTGLSLEGKENAAPRTGGRKLFR